jgi:hypothetical protein
VSDLRTKGTRVLYITPEGEHVLGTTQSAPAGTTRDGCAVVRFDNAPFTWVMPVGELKALSEEGERAVVCALNGLSFEEVRLAVIAAEQRLNHTTLHTSGGAVSRRAKVAIEHTDVPGYDEIWTITISAKSTQARGR